MTVTVARSRPSARPRHVDVLTNDDRAELQRLVAADPIVNAVIASRLNVFRSVDAATFGGVLLGSRTEPNGTLEGAVFNGGNLLPIGGTEASWDALARHVVTVPRLCTSVVGRADTVAAMWRVLEPAWGPARAIRECQPLLTVGRDDEVAVPPDSRVQVMQPADLDRYLPAAAAMFSEELGISPFAGRAGTTYRRRVESLLAAGRAFGIVDQNGRIAFKADVGALSHDTCQLQGVWVRPDLRGKGVGTGAMAAVLQHALRLAPSASLYVNDFNTAARRMYARLGMREIGSLATILF